MAVDLDVVARMEIEDASQAQADQGIVRRDRLLALHVPPLFDPQLIGKADAGYQHRAATDGDGAEQLGGDDTDVAGVLDRLDAIQVGERQLAHVVGGRGDRHASVGKRKVVGLGHDEDVGSILVQLVRYVGLHRRRDGHQGHHRGHADGQAQQE